MTTPSRAGFFFYIIKIIPASAQRNDAAATTHTKICNFHIRKCDWMGPPGAHLSDTINKLAHQRMRIWSARYVEILGSLSQGPWYR